MPDFINQAETPFIVQIRFGYAVVAFSIVQGRSDYSTCGDRILSASSMVSHVCFDDAL